MCVCMCVCNICHVSIDRFQTNNASTSESQKIKMGFTKSLPAIHSGCDGVTKLANNWRASEASETLSGLFN